MANQFATPHPTYEETHRVPIVVKGTPKPQFRRKGYFHGLEQFSAGTRGSVASSPLDTPGTPHNVLAHTQAPKPEDATSQSGQTTGLRAHAQHRYKKLSGIGARLINTHTRTIIAYLVLYIVTLLSLTVAWVFPHPWRGRLLSC